MTIKGRSYFVTALVRLVLPTSFLLCAALRPFGISIVYILLFLVSPLTCVPGSRTFKGWCGRVLLMNVLMSFLLLLLHIVWHTLLASVPPYGSILDEYPILTIVGQNLGFVSYASVEPLMAVQYMLPEIINSSVSLLVYMIVKRMLTGPLAQPAPEGTDSKYQQFPLVTSAGKYLCLILLMMSGIMRPSVTSGIYYLVFMGSATAWALGKPLNRGFAVVCRCVMVVMAVHVLAVITYQCTILEDLYPPDMEFARYFGLTKLVTINVTVSSYFTYEVTDDHMWGTLASPFVILFTYFLLALETRQLFKPKAKRKSTISGIEEGKQNGPLTRGVSYRRGSRRLARDKWKNATKRVRAAIPYVSSLPLRGGARETDPLIRVNSSKNWSVENPPEAKQLRQDSTGSVVIHEAVSGEEESELTLMDDIITAVIDFFQILVRSSYIATTITMMAWSIMFHSWLTFVFLMWANVVWLCHDQRGFMLKTSPVLVCYAMLLLVAQYIYGMNLLESEVPSNITQVNLHQIGLGRTEGETCVPLLIKSLFTCMFWVTLRQRVQDIRQRRQTVVIADLAAPLQLTASTAAPGLEAQREEESRSRLLRALGVALRALCARYWIYVVVIMLFVIGVTGQRMTIFRIIYMFLFLAFILMFQISWYLWRKLLYMFWVVVIIYSMINLILLYIYQFDNFSKMIEKYLLINESLQQDLGLEPYHPADLFVKLLTPTLFLITTILQVHYFHKDFMALSDPKTRTNSTRQGSGKPSQDGASTIRDDLPQLPSEDTNPRSQTVTEPDQSIELSSIQAGTTREPLAQRMSMSSASRLNLRTPEQQSTALWAFLKRSYQSSKHTVQDIINHIFMYLDIHLIKIVFISLMLLCVINVCALHVPIMILIAPALWLNSGKQRYCVLFISTLISIYFMAKMVYQIDYIKHSNFDVNCNSESDDSGISNKSIYNNAKWLGFAKAGPDIRLVTLLKGYIGLLALFIFYALVTYRQQSLRAAGTNHRIKIMFPKVTRMEADKDLVHCIKYLINYGFYKFGVEITMICLMGVIGSRMDLYAVLYAAWLLILVSIRRQTQARLWTTFTACITVLVPLQYMIAVGFLPQFCVTYPWESDDEQMKHIRTWMFLPYAESPPHAYKLIFDYFLLLFATRQMKVFRIEKILGENYVGGSNSENIGADWETPNFVNPVPDFLGYVGTWLDVLKRMVFLGMLWVTLAIMFMTGTNRVNLFSMGYLIGSFIFLWQGTDFYLRPKSVILRWWSWLLRYNVVVVVVKTLLQIPGCIFSSVMQEHACWLVQLLGIGCVDKFAGGNIARFLKMQYTKEAVCSVPQEDIGLAWDGVCFAFLILQRRLFHSFYFYRVIDESKATTVLASRGAELIEELRQKQMNVQEEQETKILEKIKVKMERIKANQKKIQGTLTKEPCHHDRDEEEETVAGESEHAPLVSEHAPGASRGYHSPGAASRGYHSPGASRGYHSPGAASRGYHTPDSPASPRGFHTPLSEPSAPPSPERQPARPALPMLPMLPAPSLPASQAGPPSPSSALMTVSLDAYLEPRRISFESPPSSELLARAPSPEESYPVFSPPPIRRRHTVASPSMLPRQSIVSQSSRAEPHSHHTCTESDSEGLSRRRVYTNRHEVRDRPTYRPPASHQKAIRSGDYYMFDEFDDTDIQIHDEDSSSDEDAPREMGIGKLLSTMIKTDLKNAVNLRRASAPTLRPARRLSLTDPISFQQIRKRYEPRHESHAYQEQDRPLTEIDDFAPLPEHEVTVVDKIKALLETLSAFISSLLVSLTRHIMKYSRDYRYVSKTLSIEKKVLKEKEGFGIGIREGSQMIWEPLPETLARHRKLSDISVPEIRILAPSMERGLDASPPPRRKRLSLSSASPQHHTPDEDDTSEHESAFSLQSSPSIDVTTLDDHDDSMFKQDRTPFVHFGYALWYAVLAHTDIVCYIMVFINQIQSATILSIPLPLMVFFWGTLTIPRPTKTFWVTLIAYTEVIVLIKSMFQFEILPWNQKVIPANMPFTAPRIIGIERKYNYALYDLLLLLIIFLHRFMLKSLGLWKESTPDIELREDMEYPLSPEDTQLMAQGHITEVGKKYVKLHDKSGPAEDGNADMDIDPTRRQLHFDESEAGPSKGPDDDHYNVNDDLEPIIAVTTTLESTCKHYPEVMLLSVKRYLRPTYRFFQRMLEPGARVTADIYAYMFLCDFFNFLVVIFGFAAFGTHQGDGGVQAYLEENKVPIPFLVMLILQFALIVIDRALYLRKFMLGKILFQYALIIGVHIWMFFVLPFITERTFNALLPPPLWYMLKCIYLLLSAYQIRCGYPRRIIGNFLCKSYYFLNMVCFRGFMVVPFLFELRTLMDWIWTDTSMNLMDWLKMEDIFASVFLLKCSRYIEDEFPQPRGSKKSNSSKYMLGGGVLAFIIAIIWFPLVFFAFGNTVGKPNPPTDVTVKIRIGPFLPVYQMSAQSHNIYVFTEQDYSQLSNMYARDRTAQTFLSNYQYNDVAVITINPNSTLKWEISPPELDRLKLEAASNATLMVKFTYVITHPTNAVPNPPTIEDHREVALHAYVNGRPNPQRDKLQKLLEGTADADTWLTVRQLFPKFLKVFNKGTTKAVYQLLPLGVEDYDPTNKDLDEFLYRDVLLRLERAKGTDVMYWRVRESCSIRDPLLSIPLNNCNMLVMYTFNDKLFPETLNFISGSGIIGLYTTFVFLASRVLRGFFSGIYTRIMFDDLPNADRLLQLCLDIYLVREALELSLEEDLFAKLVFLYRSPETMIKWSRPKDEENEQQALPPSR